MKNKKWYRFMATNQWAIFMSALRIFTAIALVGIIIYLFNNIEEVKLLSGDACKVCMEKVGATCFKLDLP